MAFDHFQRYKTVQIIVGKLKEQMGISQVSILEIGGNGQCNLEELLPGEKIQYSNLTVPADRIGDNRFIVLDGTDMPQVETNAYDIVVALDVYEHVPEEKRESFLRETYRVAKYMTILCFPFANGKNEGAELRVNNYYKAIYGKDHIWLIEHIENGLPDISKVKEILYKASIDYRVFEHGDINIWEDWMKALIATYDIPSVAPYLESLEEYYAKEIYSFDKGESNYRTFLMLSKQKLLVQGIGDAMETFYAKSEQQERFNMMRGLDDLKHLCMRKPCVKVQSSLYIDCGNGYTEDLKLKHDTATEVGKETKIRCKYELPQHVVGIRFDPVEDCGCIISGVCAESDQGFLQVIPIGGWKQGDSYVFLGNDPQLQLVIGDKKIAWIEISASIYVYTERKDGIFLKAVEALVTENENIMMEKVKEAQEKSIEAVRKVCEAEKRTREAQKAAEIMKGHRDQLEIEKRELDIHLVTEKKEWDIRLQEANSRVEALQKEKDDFAVRWEQEKQKADFYENAYEKVMHSKSWKVTSPLRKLFGQERGRTQI